MENISKQQISKLVLGYLKEEKYKKAFRNLLESSPYLRGFLRKVKKGYPISYRVCGLNLVDIINEYSAIYRIVQERLEATNYFNTTQGRKSLIEQLIFLLDRVQYSPSSSVCSFENRSSPEKDFSFNNFNGNVYNDSGTDNIDNSEVKATPSSSLPGNVNRSTESSTSTTSEDMETAMELLAQKLLENREFHEKLAENINKEVNFSTSPHDERQNLLNQELDAAIKTVLQKTEADPIFNKLLTDILDSVDIDNVEDPPQNESRLGNDGQENHRTGNHSPNDLVIACSDSDHSKKDPTSKLTTTNFEKSSLFPNTNFTNQTTNLNTQTQQFTVSNTVPVPEVPSNIPVVYTSSESSSLSHFINVTSTVPNCITIPAQPLIVHNNQNQQLVSSGGLLMMQQQNQKTSKPYQVVGGKQLVNITPKWTLNEQDIMSMPTVFISDSQPVMPSISIGSQPLLTLVAKEPDKDPPAKKSKRKIAPKTNNMPSLSNSPYPPAPSEQKRIKTLLPKSAAANDTNATPKINITTTTITTTTTYENPNDQQSTTGDPITTTPLTAETNTVKKQTPKSTSSHVRQLDFSTPEKAFPEDQDENKKSETKEVDKAVENIKTKDITSRTKSWDTDLRALAGIPETRTETSTAKTPAKKRKRTNSTTNKSTSDERQKTRNKKTKLRSSSSSSSTCSQDARETKRTTVNDAVVKEAEAEEQPFAEENKIEASIEKVEPVESKSTTMVEEEEEESVEMAIDCVVINRNIKPTYRKKCNIDNSKRNVIVEKVVPCPTASSSSKNSLDIIDDLSPTLILSPTKLNANKRSIVEVDNKDEIVLETSNETCIPKAAPVLNTKYNITPSLETPSKKGQPLPKTPRFLSPVNTSDTPFTKVLKEQLQGLDLSSFPTPKFPLTPDLAVTPLIHDQSPYSRRSTDYSTSSSYYQPSDTEQTKSIEQLLIEEGMRLENRLEEKSGSASAHFSQSDISEKRNNFNSLMTGKKNLSLMKKSVEEKLHLTLSSSEDNSSSSSDENNPTNDTVIQNKVPYSLRSRGTVTEIKKQEETSKDKSKIHDALTSNDTVANSKNIQILQSLEEKRKSVIAKLKEDDLKREEENQKSLQKNKSKATGNVSKKKSTSVETTKRNNSSTKKKLSQSKTNVVHIRSNSEEVSKEENKKVAISNPKIKDKESSQSKIESKPEETPRDKLDKVDLKVEKSETENTSDSGTKVTTLTTNDKNSEETVPVENPIATSTSEEIDDTSKIQKATDKLKKVTPPSKVKSDKTDSLPVNPIADLPVMPQQVSITKDVSASEEKKENVPAILQQALTDACIISSIPKEPVSKGNPDENLKKETSSVDVIDPKLNKTSKENLKSNVSDKIVVHSNVKILLEKLPDSCLKSKLPIENDMKKEKKNAPLSFTSITPRKNETKRRKSDTSQNSTAKDVCPKKFEKFSHRYSPVDEIILHLSSDDSFGSFPDNASETTRKGEFTSRLLEPFELVQTQLHELGSESERCEIENKLKKLHDDNSTNDPEILVKELKERGIHLMPAKGSRRNTITDNKDNQQMLKLDTKTIAPKESNKKEVKKTNGNNCSQPKEKKIPSNISLEEGEILSDLSDSESKISEKQARSNRNRTSRSERSRKEFKVEVNKLRTYERKRDGSKFSRDKEKATSTNKSSSSKSTNKSSKEIKSSSTKAAVEENKVPSSNDKNSETQKSNYQSTGRKPPEKTINTENNELDSSLSFHTMVYNTETLHLIYDEAKQSSNNKQYNLELLTKKISANVFIEEINSEVEREMSFTRFKSVLDIPSTLNVNVLSPRKKPKVEKGKSPLDRLYEKLQKHSPADTSYKSSPLDSLYSPLKTGLYNRKAEVTEESKRPKTNKLDEQKLTESKSREDKISNKKNVKNKSDDSEEKQGKGGKWSNSTKKSVEISNLPDDEIEVTNGVISFNAAEKVTPDPNDELMNYAICGSVRIEDDDTEFSEKKRKANTNVDEIRDEKKVRTDNCQELLKKIDVASFLKKVHGNG